MPKPTRTTGVWVLLSSAGYPAICYGMYLSRRELMAHVKKWYGLVPKDSGYRPIKATLTTRVP